MLSLPALLSLLGSVHLSEIQANPPSGLPEFVELAGSPGDVLTGWSLRSGEVQAVLGPVVLGGSGLLVVASDCPRLQERFPGGGIPCASPSRWPRLAGAADHLALVDPDGLATDSVSWSEAMNGRWEAGATLERDGLGGWRLDASTPGGTPGWIPTARAASGALSIGLPRRTFLPGQIGTILLEAPQEVVLELYDLGRRRRATLHRGLPPQRGAVEWDGRVEGRALEAGVYVLLARSGESMARAWIAVGAP